MMNNVVLVVSFFLYLNWSFSAFPSFLNIFPVVDVHIKYGQKNPHQPKAHDADCYEHFFFFVLMNPYNTMEKW